MKTAVTCLLALAWLPATANAAGGPPVSKDTQGCLDCHESATPGIVADWRRSLHARVTPGESLKKPELERRVSATSIPAEVSGVAVGCAECHTANATSHPDTFRHEGYDVHPVVSPRDCANCHPLEAREFSDNLMSRAHGNLEGNPLYGALCDEVNGRLAFDGTRLVSSPPSDVTRADSCLHCHGTRVTATGKRTLNTDQGDMEIPVLDGWPNQGVGRVNPDGSLGSCAACHARHQFSIEVTRKPETCSQCHKGPDVPAYRIWQVSKHGNIFGSVGHQWRFDTVPWVAGEDFTAPTCAACHISLVVAKDGTLYGRRTHRMNDRLERRLFGLIYSHPHPVDADTSGIRNRAGLPLPTELTGEPVESAVIGTAEQAGRRATMQRVCEACHSTQWTEGHFARLDESVRTADSLVLAATRIVQAAWEKGLAKGPDRKASPFDEPIERMWVAQWLFYGNSTRMATAMAGADYGVFADGRWSLTRNLRDMMEWLEARTKKR
jgi:hypothetical protein